MNYAIVENGIIQNTIIIEDEQYVSLFHALPLKEGQGIGDIYEAPDSEPKKETDISLEMLLDAIIE